MMCLEKISFFDVFEDSIVEDIPCRELEVNYHSSIHQYIHHYMAKLSDNIEVNFCCQLTHTQWNQLSKHLLNRMKVRIKNSFLNICITKCNSEHGKDGVLLYGTFYGEPWELNGFDKILLYSKKGKRNVA